MVIFFFFIIWSYYGRYLLADYYYLAVRRAMRGRNYVALLENYQKIFNLQNRESFYQQNYVDDLLTIANQTNFLTDEHKIKFYQIALQNIEAIPENERIYDLDKRRAIILGKIAELTQNQNDFIKAETAIQRVVEQSPKMAQNYLLWCDLKIYQKNWSAALEKCQRALSLYPDLNHPHLNPEHRAMIMNEMVVVYEKLGQIYFEQKNYDNALESYWKLLHLNPFRAYIYKKIADVYYLRKDLETAIKYNLHGAVLSPYDYAWPLALALLYQEKGDLKTARFYGQKALELNPESPAIKNLLKKLR
jgi:tetratricopeptide (TPR) repeat protein